MNLLYLLTIITLILIIIFRYLSSNYDIDNHWYPKDIRSRALVDEYLEWQHNNTRTGLGLFFQIKKKIGPFANVEGDTDEEGMLPIFKYLMETTLDIFENVWLENEAKKFLVSDEISFADILAACEIEQPRMAGYDPFEGRPKLRNWYERVKEATKGYYDEAHVIVNKIIKKNQSKL